MAVDSRGAGSERSCCPNFVQRSSGQSQQPRPEPFSFSLPVSAAAGAAPGGLPLLSPRLLTRGVPSVCCLLLSPGFSWLGAAGQPRRAPPGRVVSPPPVPVASRGRGVASRPGTAATRGGRVPSAGGGRWGWGPAGELGAGRIGPWGSRAPAPR